MQGRGRIYAQNIVNLKGSVFVEKDLKERGKLQALLLAGGVTGVLGFAEGFYPGKTRVSSQGCGSGVLLEPGKVQADQTKESDAFVLVWGVTTESGLGRALGGSVLPRVIAGR